jgi:hypothetical protein
MATSAMIVTPTMIATSAIMATPIFCIAGYGACKEQNQNRKNNTSGPFHFYLLLVEDPCSFPHDENSRSLTSILTDIEKQSKRHKKTSSK